MWRTGEPFDRAAKGKGFFGEGWHTIVSGKDQNDDQS